MTYDFDHVPDRHGTGSLKYDCAAARGHGTDELPLWVADMDFPTPPAVVDALVARARHGIFGYTEPDEAYFEAVRGWLGPRYGLFPADEDLIVTPGVVFALAAAVNAFTRPGEPVLVQPPVYYPFGEVIEDNGRVRVEAPLTRDESTLEFGLDAEAFERAIVENGVRLFLLCNPHNPVGHVWDAADLRTMGDICIRHQVVVVSDEIHADFAAPGYSHTAFAALGERYARICVTCTSASKTFNLAGLQVANILVSDPGLRGRLRRAVGAAGYSQANVMGLVATRAAYEHCGPWLEELNAYLASNHEFLLAELARRAPELRVAPRQSTYLAWVDCRALGLNEQQLTDLVEKDAQLWLDMGHVFGPSGAGFVRINLACPRATLAEALDRLCGAVRAVMSGRSDVMRGTPST